MTVFLTKFFKKKKNGEKGRFTISLFFSGNRSIFWNFNVYKGIFFPMLRRCFFFATHNFHHLLSFLFPLSSFSPPCLLSSPLSPLLSVVSVVVVFSVLCWYCCFCWLLLLSSLLVDLTCSWAIVVRFLSHVRYFCWFFPSLRSLLS